LSPDFLLLRKGVRDIADSFKEVIRHELGNIRAQVREKDPPRFFVFVYVSALVGMAAHREFFSRDALFFLIPLSCDAMRCAAVRCRLAGPHPRNAVRRQADRATARHKSVPRARPRRHAESPRRTSRRDLFLSVTTVCVSMALVSRFCARARMCVCACVCVFSPDRAALVPALRTHAYPADACVCVCVSMPNHSPSLAFACFAAGLAYGQRAHRTGARASACIRADEMFRGRLREHPCTPSFFFVCVWRLRCWPWLAFE
jgi:hypothetical protein